MKLYKGDADNCILALRNTINQYDNLAQNSKEEYLKKEFKSLSYSMKKTLELLESEFCE